MTEGSVMKALILCLLVVAYGAHAGSKEFELCMDKLEALTEYAEQGRTVVRNQFFDERTPRLSTFPPHAPVEDYYGVIDPYVCTKEMGCINLVSGHRAAARKQADECMRILDEEGE